jgi:hypothetical protein
VPVHSPLSLLPLFRMHVRRRTSMHQLPLSLSRLQSRLAIFARPTVKNGQQRVDLVMFLYKMVQKTEGNGQLRVWPTSSIGHARMAKSHRKWPFLGSKV